MSALKIKDDQGNWINLPGLKGDKGDKGDKGESGVYLGTTAPSDEDINVWINPSGEAHTEAVVVDPTLMMEGQAADSKAVGDEFRKTNADLGNSAGNLLYQQYASGTSGLMPFRVKNGDTITVKRTDDSVFENVQLRFYDFNRNLVNHLTLLSNHGTSRTATVNLSSECFYIGITVVTEETPKTYVIVNKSNEYYQKQEALKQEDAKIHEAISELSDIAVHKNLINRFNPSTVHEGKYIAATTGEDAVNSDFFASDYIYIGDLDRVTVSYTHIFGWYDADKNWLGHPDSMASRSADKVYDKPADAVYMRFSTYNSDLNVAQIGESVDRASYVQYGEFTISGFVAQKNQIIVDASGNGDYTSFTEALYENVNNGVDVIVKAGIYDIVDEYIALFGQEAVDNMADSDSAIFNGFQYGVKITNRKVEFMAGAHLVCDWTGHTVDGTHRFSALAVGINAEIIGLNLDCTATFYAIHDDYGVATNEYTNIYRFCRVIGHSMTNVNCIGGGCKPHSRHIIDNCYFDNNTSSSTAVRFHNTNAEGAEPEIYVSNSFFNTYFRANWYGNQTSKMRVYVNNCYAKAIHKGQESSRYTTDNVELYKWNNTETNPVE